MILDSVLPVLKDKKVTIFFNDSSEPIKGEVLAYSKYEILLMSPDGQLLVFKQSIRAIKPEKPIEIKKLLGDMQPPNL